MKFKHALILLFLLFATVVQAQDKLFEKYSDKDNVTSIYISKAMFSMFSGSVDLKGLPIDNLSDKLESLQILIAEEPDEAKKMNKEFSSHVRKQHEELMRIKDGETNMKIYVKKKGTRVQELILFAQDKEELTIIRLLGNFTMKDIQDFAKMVE